ncbi:protein bicaudal C 1-like protein [Dinothrombium tinctorium]|uniref:Protein bicaudal C 1-like protein n=1 Tax=Dinothrombium tinctorium TaxID=1965070 RepID=A0A3S3Q0Q3_9ACAR|nr:protein bicaudal C 1-like protein [Dinothrombium tinctorium]
MESENLLKAGNEFDEFFDLETRRSWICSPSDSSIATGTEATTLPNGFLEERVKVDRKKFEQMINGENMETGPAEDFFKRIMRQTNTEITWPPKLKVGTKSKKDPHIRIVGTSSNIVAAKEAILALLDSRRNRVTLKMDVAFTDHSHIIGKGGRCIQKVMDETGCHIHFPDSNRTNTVEKSNQVSIAGTALGSEQARCRIRELLPLTFMFELPVNSISSHVFDVSSPTIQGIQQTFGLTICMRFSGKPSFKDFGSNGTAFVTVCVRGTRGHILGLRQGILVLLEYLLGSNVNVANVPLTLNIDIASQHHSFVMGRGNCNIRSIMQQTGAVITFPDPSANDSQISPIGNNTSIRKSTVTIKGPCFDSVYCAWQELLGYLPLVLIFDLREGQELDAAQITQLMDQLKVSILIKPKQKQNLKSIMVRGPERDSRLLFEVRRQILDLDESEIPVCCEQHAWLFASKLLSIFLPYCSIPPPITPFKPMTQGTFGSSGMTSLPPTISDQTFIAPNPVLLQALMNQAFPANFQNTLNHSIEPCKNYDKNLSTSSSLTATPSVTSNSSGGASPDEKLSPQNKTLLSFSKKTPNMSGNTFGWPESKKTEYEDRKFLASKMMRSKPNVSEARTPTSVWSGLGFSKSMPASVLKSKLAADWDTVTEMSSNNYDNPLQSSSLWNSSKSAKMKYDFEKTNNLPFSQSNYFEGMSWLRSLSQYLPSSKGSADYLNLDLSVVLSQLGLSKYIEDFQRHEIDFKTFITLNDADLQELDIPYFGRRKLLNAIKDLRRLLKLEPECVSPSTHFEAAPGAERSRRSKMNP